MRSLWIWRPDFSARYPQAYELFAKRLDIFDHTFDIFNMSAQRLHKKSPQIATIQAKVLRGILNSVLLKEPIKKAILETAGLSAEALVGEASVVPFKSYLTFFDAMAKACENECLGLELSQQVGPELVGAIGYIFVSSPDLRTALRALTSSVFTIQDVTEFKFSPQGEHITTYRITDENMRPQRQDVEFSLGYVHGLVRQLLGPRHRPVEVWFEHDRPQKLGAYDKVFGCPVYFGQTQNCLVYTEADLSRPAARFDPNLVALMQHYIQLLGHRHHAITTMHEAVSQALTPLIEDQDPTIGAVAEALSVSEATLRRRLKSEGTSFRQILRTKRMDVAKRLLSETGMSVLEIAQRLGYAESASFGRAFVTETQKTPTAYRQKSRAKLRKLTQQRSSALRGQ